MDEKDREAIAAEVGKLGIPIDAADIPEIDPGMLEQGIIDIMTSRAKDLDCDINQMAIYCTLVPETRVLRSKKKHRPMLQTIFWNKEGKLSRTPNEPVRKYSSLDTYGGLISRTFRDILLAVFHSKEYEPFQLEIEEVCIQFTASGAANTLLLSTVVKSKINQGQILEKIDLKEIFK